jgi:hypothetical protein
VAREIGNSAALRPFTGREVLPGSINGVKLEQYFRDGLVTFWHQCGTAKMGRDAMSVVDGKLNVYSVDGLRIAEIDTIRRQLGNMAEVLGILERMSLDDLILRVLKKSVSAEQVKEIANEELKSMEEMAENIRKTQFLSGCRQFTDHDISQAETAVEEAQQAIPTYKDVREFIEAFLRVFGEAGGGERDGRKLHQTKDKGVFRLLVPPVLQDEKLPKVYPRVTFDRGLRRPTGGFTRTQISWRSGTPWSNVWSITAA